MCNPVVFAMAAMAAVSVAQQADAAKQQTALAKQNQKSAHQSLLDAYDAQSVQSNQQRDAAGQAATQNAVEAAQARASMQAAASDSNISGLSIDSLINEATRQEATNYQNLAVNQSYAEEQRQREGAGLRNQAQSRIDAVPRGSFSPILGLLQIGASAYAGKAGAKTPAAPAAAASKGT